MCALPDCFCKNPKLYDARCWGFRGLEHAICSNQTGREAPLIMPRPRVGECNSMQVPEAGRQVSSKQCKLTDVRVPSVPGGVAEPEGKQIIQASSRKFGMERVSLRPSGTGGSAATL